MALIASLLAFAGRFVGKVLTTTLGWASILLFGRIPQDRQVWLAVLGFGSLAWVAAVIGILVPDLGAILLAAVPLPDWVPDWIVRLVMLAVAVALPAVLGGVTLLLSDPEDRPKGRDLLVQLARGYLIVPTLAVSLVVLAVAGTVRKLVALSKRLEDAHLPMVVRPGRYDALVARLEATLDDGGMAATRAPGSTILAIPARILAKVAGQGIGRLVPDRLVELRARDVTRDAHRVPGRPRHARAEGGRRAGAGARDARRLVARCVVHDDEGGAGDRGSARNARIGRPGDTSRPVGVARSRPPRPDGRSGHVRGALPASPPAGDGHGSRHRSARGGPERRSQ
jgi:hypothetical protein